MHQIADAFAQLFHATFCATRRLASASAMHRHDLD